MAEEKNKLAIMEGIKQVFTLKGVLSIGIMAWALQNFLATFDLIPDTWGIIGKFDDVVLVLIGFWAAKDLISAIMGAVKKRKG